MLEEEGAEAPNNNLPVVAAASRSSSVLQGTPKQVLGIITLVWFISFLTTVLASLIVSALNDLSTKIKLILIALSGIPSVLLQIFIGHKIDQNGGMRTIKSLRAISSAGALGLCIFSATTDNLNDIDFTDWRYALLLAALLILANVSAAIYALIGAVVYWSTEQNRARHIAIFGGVGGLGPGIGLIALEFAREGLGLTGALGIFLGLSLFGTGLAFYLVPDFYHQLLSKKLSPVDAKRIAKERGQFYFPIERKESMGAALRTASSDLRCLVSIINVLSSAGAALAANVSLNQILFAVAHLSKRDAALIAGGASLLATAVRAPAGEFMQRYDPSKGVYTFIIGSLLSFVASLILAAPENFPGLAAIIPVILIMSVGFGLSAAAMFQLVVNWIKEPKNKKLKSCDLGITLGVVGSAGASSAIFMPLITALLAAIYDERGYAYGFFLNASLSAIAASLTFFMDRYVNSGADEPVVQQAEQLPDQVSEPSVRLTWI